MRWPATDVATISALRLTVAANDDKSSRLARHWRDDVTLPHQHAAHGLVRAVEDRRRVDELITDFEYDGVLAVPAEGARQGQGAVKRLLTAFLADNKVNEVDIDARVARWW